MDALDFEQPLDDLDKQISSLKSTANKKDLQIVQQLEQQHKALMESVYGRLTPWQTVQIARHPKRPKSLAYIDALFNNTFELEGDRAGHTDKAVLTMIAEFDNKPVMIIAQEKGVDLETRQKHNFGMVGPAGYRKVKRCVELASRWKLPIITLIDTSGAYPCKEAEELGQAEAIASSMAAFFKAEVPVIACVIGEGGSGGAIGIGVANTVLMLQYAVYSIAAPEAVSSILFKTAEKKVDAAKALKLTARDLQQTGYVDVIVPEPVGGAHRYPQQTIENVKQALSQALDKLHNIDGWLLLKTREEKFRRFGSDLLL